MRKYILIIPLFLLLFFPFNVFATNTAGWIYLSNTLNGGVIADENGYFKISSTLNDNGYKQVELYRGNNRYFTFDSNYTDYLMLNVFVRSYSWYGSGDTWTTGSGSTSYTYQNNDISMTFRLEYEKSSNRNDIYGTLCELSPNANYSNGMRYFTVICPTFKGYDSFRGIIMNVTGTFEASQIQFDFAARGDIIAVGGNNVSSEIANQTQSIINSQNQIIASQNQTNSTLNDMNNSINNSSTTDANTKGSSFFSNFGSHDNAHLTTIITAPLRLFNAMKTECTQPLSIPIGFNNSTNGAIPNRNINISCYANFWNREDVQTFRTFWNLLIGGPAIYGLLVLLMKAFNKALDPLEDGLIAIDIAPNKVKKDNGSDEQV